ncbi:trypsin-like serine peptidase [Bacillus toyonensis]|uniref:trypsin-like serine peptidase n=1 Tax=Bacillus toyonensis TaxID=155322 RepID=UPI000BEE47E0|nr:trypsin-like peptidase domain-containing protein [Bacillus toyonensis]PEA69020.1 hypothetical protein COO00_29800 [Bacillus toyonensis]PEE32115.1 hypothetical protein CON98_00120 [Bacillus toyonensis]PFX78385.1 hypothetical protein COL38_23200 [Bacillus toyonensis]PFX91197.1 hypothetical protein COL37_12845 [Bacillus toyonensis]PGB20589.1 hypothetical protein COL98_09895 [Bacillus toyonensis]
MSNLKKSFSTKSYTQEESQKVLEYWTPERMANAKPMSPPKIKDNILPKQFNKLSTNNSTCFSSRVCDEPYEVAIHTRPYMCGGKFFFTKKVGNQDIDFTGSGQFVWHCLMVLTAAHCIKNHETGEFYDNLIFARGYKENDDGTSEKEFFTFEMVGTSADWPRSENFSDLDYAFCRTRKPYQGQVLSIASIGHSSTGDPMLAMGYPDNYGDKKRMYAVYGIIGEIRDKTFFMECNPFQEGASGGAHMADITIGDNTYSNTVIGIHSQFHETKPLVLSPIFDEAAFDLFNKILDASGGNRDVCSTD